MARVKRGRVPPPPPKGGWTLRFDSHSAEEGWEVVCTQFPGPTRKAFETLERDPFEHGERQHRLKGSDGTVTIAGKDLEQWQYELTGAARILYAADRDKRTVFIIEASPGHLKATERVRG